MTSCQNTSTAWPLSHLIRAVREKCLLNATAFGPRSTVGCFEGVVPCVCVCLCVFIKLTSALVFAAELFRAPGPLCFCCNCIWTVRFATVSKVALGTPRNPHSLPSPNTRRHAYTHIHTHTHTRRHTYTHDTHIHKRKPTNTQTQSQSNLNHPLLDD